MFHDLGKRFLFSVLAILFTAVLLYFSPWIMLLVGIVIATIATLALKEYIQIVKNKGVVLHTPSMVTAAVIFILLPTFMLSLHSLLLWPKYQTIRLIFPFLERLPLFLLFVIPLLTAFIQHLKSPEGFIARISFSVWGLLYIVIPLSLIIQLLYFPVIDGRLLVAWIIAATKFSDMAAYFVGRRFGKHKMAPIASPNKTWEGCIAGIVTSVLISLLVAMIAKKYEGFSLPISNALIAGVLFGIGSQFGDLFESLLKRDAQVKDSGLPHNSSIPGLGGVLDTLDSLLVNIYMATFFCFIVVGMV